MLFNDLKLFLHMARGPGRSPHHRERMERLYQGQAAGYDSFRDRFLHGRRELYESLEIEPGGRLVEIGGGTARNLEFLGDRLGLLARAWVVDISPSMLATGRQRRERLGWTNVEIEEGDAITWSPGAASVDTVVFSYSLSMIPGWFRAIDNALTMLKPGGVLAVVDFLGVGPNPDFGFRRRSALYRTFWRCWCGRDQVALNPDLPAYLDYRTRRIHLSEHQGPVPYLPLLKVPYYRFVGRKPAED